MDSTGTVVPVVPEYFCLFVLLLCDIDVLPCFTQVARFLPGLCSSLQLDLLQGGFIVKL